MNRVSQSHNVFLMCEGEIDCFLEVEDPPCVDVVLVSAREIPSESSGGVERLYRFLRKTGAKVVLCVGESSEALHDAIDTLCEMGGAWGEGVVTTYHDDESIEDIVNFFLYGSGFYGVKDACFYVIAGVRDEKIIKALERA